MLKNKKAQVGELTQDTVALIFIAFLLIFFVFLSSFLWGLQHKSLGNITVEQFTRSQERISLAAFLQKNIEINVTDTTRQGQEKEKQNITISDLIKLSNINNSYNRILEDEAEKAFGSLYNCELSLEWPGGGAFGRVIYPKRNEIKSDDFRQGGSESGLFGEIIPSEIKGFSFYIPFNKTIAIKLRIKNLK